jgi:UDP-2,4-diacetamido-2,4,6-trideoxy-beta-L-altropyranose hydrolase
VKVAFRTDASLAIGTGHVMRCLTLADALSKHGVESVFLTRDHTGNLHSTVEIRGHRLLSLGGVAQTFEHEPHTGHEHWLGVSLQQDIDDTAAFLSHFRPDWLVVDHYALDGKWEEALAPLCDRIMAIDDLANRRHAADLLLDQNLGTTSAQYTPQVPAQCDLLLGPQYGLLRPAFAALRSESLARRRHGQLSTILVTMGGVDIDNTTGMVLDSLRSCASTMPVVVTIVMGQHAPWREQIKATAAASPFPNAVLVNPPNMAELMRDADLAIGAAGGTSWERCCLGLPTLQVVIAENQRRIASALRDAGAARSLERPHIPTALTEAIAFLASHPTELRAMSDAAALVSDGRGAERVAQHLLKGRLS